MHVDSSLTLRDTVKSVKRAPVYSAGHVCPNLGWNGRGHWIMNIVAVLILGASPSDWVSVYLFHLVDGITNDSCVSCTVWMVCCTCVDVFLRAFVYIALL